MSKEISSFVIFCGQTDDAWIRRIFNDKDYDKGRSGCEAQRLHTCFSPSSPGFDSQRAKEFFLLSLLRFIAGSAQRSGQKLDYVNGTHQVLASGKI